MEDVECNTGAIFFVDDLGGTGKTYLYRALLASVRSQGRIAITTATSGIAATLLPGGRTAHSRFKIPLNPEASSVCPITKQSDMEKLIRCATVIIWDEATMTNRYAFEALNQTLIDITGVDYPFGGKITVFGGDFRQVLPVVPKGTKAETVAASIVKSPFSSHIQVIRLKQNMRSINDQQFCEFLLSVGDGVQPTIIDEMIKVLTSMAIP
ncbi:ATP-dependent DNA helicase PIF2-like [Camellia sinensis]|uniref:ATP-dependent DNA helicase PIF2-like n=1 Tax=Camellia sinensis TaxID=4442 RepID=UPI0010355F92|nr:ATP-dependent DNA helicase PIF2-like [Camellia sinensis]